MAEAEIPWSVMARTHMFLSAARIRGQPFGRRVLQKPAPSLSDLCVCVCVCACVPLCAFQKQGIRGRGSGLCKVFVYPDICVAEGGVVSVHFVLPVLYPCVCSRCRDSREAVVCHVGHTHIHVCVSQAHLVCAHGSGLWCLSVVFGDADLRVCEWWCC